MEQKNIQKIVTSSYHDCKFIRTKPMTDDLKFGKYFIDFRVIIERFCVVILSMESVTLTGFSRTVYLLLKNLKIKF